MILDAVLAAKGYSCVPLCGDHLLMDFECGHGSDLATWLRNHATAYQQEKLSQVWVLANLSTNSVRGYFSLSPRSIMLESIAKSDRYDDKGNANEVSHLPHIPANLLGKFALDESVQRQGTGALLMACVYAVHLSSVKQVGGKYLVVEAREPRLVSYYEHRYGFVRSLQPRDGLVSLYRLTSMIEVDLQAALS
jgi:hypothetical protein